ncbi:OmpH family outer membrane protein [Colwellia sp. E2M01]|uniref:OmpH family outer membrane protein n=1 Tax=Colwellia sp. E2M01 TaxID=2841561 RepID=UPI001C0A25E5|nr:OmpH family outer membrane protein [Colwellia sp. E2M01]MBU2869892.1 OmpH family outer membrane protein [Colwellia sp. E2M01]
MKKVIKTMVMGVAATGALLASSAMAADQKIGVVDFQAVMQKIPQTAALMQSLENEFKDEKATITQLEKDIKYYTEKLQRDGSLMSETEKAELEKTVQSLYQDYQVKGKALQQKATERQNQETNKIIALVRQTVDGIAVKGDYDLVLAQQGVVYSKPSASITDLVIEQVSKIK